MSNDIKMTNKISVYDRQQLLKYNLSEEEYLKNAEMPVEYFTGRVDFAGVNLKVNKQVLIPRIETEELVDHAFTALKKTQQHTIRILDLGTGCGAIALALINRLGLVNFFNKKWEFYLLDISQAAIKLAETNFQQLFVHIDKKDSLQVHFVTSNLLEKLTKDLQFDLVVANLPYIPSRQINNLANSVKHFEPLIALDGGDTGFTLIAQALEQLLKNNFLTKNATLLFETDSSHDRQFINNYYPNLLKKFAIDFIKDQFARQRFLRLKML